LSFFENLVTKRNDYSVEMDREVDPASQRIEILKTLWNSNMLTVKTKIYVPVSCVFCIPSALCCRDMDYIKDQR